MNFLEKILRFFAVYIVFIPMMILIFPVQKFFYFFTMSHPALFRPRNTPANHKRKVEKVQAQVREWNRSGRKKLMCTARPGWKTINPRSLQKSRFTGIRLDNLEDIIEIKTLNNNMFVRVEPGIKMGTLTRELLNQGWTIPVVPELETLTVGGLVNGAGIETSSHKYGLFAGTCLEYEIVLADGSVVTCSKTSRADLFYAIEMSHGTLGFLTAVTIPLIPATRYVKLEYYPTKSLDVAQELMTRSEYEFIEGIMYSRHSTVVMLGTMTDEDKGYPINHVNRWYKPWFYKHVEEILNKGQPFTELIPIRDYYHRHQRAVFWELAFVFPYANSPIIRHLFGWAFTFNIQLMKFLTNEYFRDLIAENRHVIQDFLVPWSKLEATIEFSHNEVEIYPIWLCPTNGWTHPQFFPRLQAREKLYMDVGIYGVSPKREGYDARTKIRNFQKFLIDNQGYQALYAETYMTPEEAREMFIMDHYDHMRKKLKCEDAFPDVHHKLLVR